MKKMKFPLLILIYSLLLSCEKGYDDEIFIEKYLPIYGKWQYQYSIGEAGFIKLPNYTVEFIPFSLFKYNSEKKGEILIVHQDENSLELDFNNLFPNIKYAYIGISNMGDTLMISPTNSTPRSLYTRIK
jgi:hypothetical protein